MIDIRITEFRGYTEEMFLDYLQCHEEALVRITIPKFYDDSVRHLLISDYQRALYVGQLLGRIAVDVMHSSPDPAREGEFQFTIITHRLRCLAEVLEYIATGCDLEGDQEAYIAFEEASFYVEESLEEGEGFACPYFMEVIQQYMTDLK
jgi:hypothetical protein